MNTTDRVRHGALLSLAVFAVTSLGGNCGSGVTADGGSATDAATDGGSATCASVCACLASACADFPFSPDCVTACQDPTHPPWDLGCRATECSAARTSHDAHCPNASGQTRCR